MHGSCLLTELLRKPRHRSLHQDCRCHNTVLRRQYTMPTVSLRKRRCLPQLRIAQKTHSKKTNRSNIRLLLEYRFRDAIPKQKTRNGLPQLDQTPYALPHSIASLTHLTMIDNIFCTLRLILGWSSLAKASLESHVSVTSGWLWYGF